MNNIVPNKVKEGSVTSIDRLRDVQTVLILFPLSPWLGKVGPDPYFA